MTTHSTWGVNSAYVQVKHDDIRSLTELMREVGIKRIALNGLEIEIGPEPRQKSDDVAEPPEPVVAAGVFAESTGAMCSCGHSWVTEHSDSGCLMGCSHDLCSSSGGMPDVG